MKFLVDMPLSPKTANYLHSLGYDTVHLSSLGKERASDEEIVQLAKEQNRIILSTDLDFGTIMAYSKAVIPGVILFRVEYATPEKINLLLKKLLLALKPDDLKDSLVVIDDLRVRLRKLPIT
ncbi:MAG: DUF5615 family PIN-like protein [Candidatus Omnitrophota bacterium]